MSENFASRPLQATTIPSDILNQPPNYNKHDDHLVERWLTYHLCFSVLVVKKKRIPHCLRKFSHDIRHVIPQTVVYQRTAQVVPTFHNVVHLSF